MNLSFYTGAVGAYMQQKKMNVQGNNISNIGTHGFKAGKVTFHQLMYGNVLGIDEEQLPRGCGTKVSKVTVDFGPGIYQDTGRTYDFAIEGNGFFALYDPRTGEISFTRDGAFMRSQFTISPPEDAEPEIDPDTGEEIEPQPTVVWRLSDNEGRCVLDPQGNFIDITDLSRDEISVDRLDIGVFDYVVREGLQHLNSGRFTPIEKNGDLYLGTGRVIQHYLEGSNTDLAEEFVKVIEASRAYSYALKMVQTSDEIETTINGLRS